MSTKSDEIWFKLCLSLSFLLPFQFNSAVELHVLTFFFSDFVVSHLDTLGSLFIFMLKLP